MGSAKFEKYFFDVEMFNDRLVNMGLTYDSLGRKFSNPVGRSAITHRNQRGWNPLHFWELLRIFRMSRKKAESPDGLCARKEVAQ